MVVVEAMALVAVAAVVEVVVAAAVVASSFLGVSQSLSWRNSWRISSLS